MDHAVTIERELKEVTIEIETLKTDITKAQKEASTNIAMLKRAHTMVKDLERVNIELAK